MQSYCHAFPGGWCVLGFVARLGFIADFLSRPILAGYVFGSGIIIVVSQLESLLGLEIDESLYTTDVGAVFRNLDDIRALCAVADDGIAGAITGRALYEVNDVWHHHFVCRHCGEVEDVPCLKGRKPCLTPSPPIGLPARSV